MQWFSRQILIWAAQEKVTFTKEWALETLPVTERAFEAASVRAMARGELLQPRRGFYVIVAPCHLIASAPPALEVIDDLMTYERADYYIGMRKAAELVGVLDRAPSDFQVVSTKRMAGTEVGRARLVFFSSREMPPERLIERMKVGASTVRISKAALTAADLIRYPQAAGINLYQLLFELGGRIAGDQLELLAQSASMPVLQRLGFAFDQVGQYELADELAGRLDGTFRAVSWKGTVNRDLPTAMFDKRWKVYCYTSDLRQKASSA
jgi:hypothetical protein